MSQESCDYADDRPCLSLWDYAVKKKDDRRYFHFCIEHLFIFARAEEQEAVRMITR